MRVVSAIARMVIIFCVLATPLFSPVVARGMPPGYHTYEEIMTQLEGLRASHPSIMTLVQIGTSVEGRPILALKLSDNPSLDEDEPEVLYLALHHGREVITTEVAMAWVRYLAETYEADADTRSLVDSHELWVVPMVNPDAFVMVEEGNVSQRKNARGVDLNRNYGFMWGADDVGSSGNPEDEMYRGTRPFSEPETGAIRSLVESHSFVTALSWHSGIEVILFPWTYTASRTPDDDLFRRIAANMSEASGYRFASPVDGTMYVANGELDDWLYGEHDVFALTVEVFGGNVDDAWGFFNPPADMLPSVLSRNVCLASLFSEIASSPKNLSEVSPSMRERCARTIPVFFGMTNIPPQISEVEADVFLVHSVVTWKTDVPSSSEVTFRKTGKDEVCTARGESGTSHRVVLSGLSFGTRYSYTIISEDERGNVSEKWDLEFETLDIVPPLVGLLSFGLFFLIAWQVKKWTSTN